MGRDPLLGLGHLLLGRQIVLYYVLWIAILNVENLWSTVITSFGCHSQLLDTSSDCAKKSEES